MGGGIQQSGIALANSILMTESFKTNQAWGFVEGKDDLIGLQNCFNGEVVVIYPANSKDNVIEALAHYLKHSISGKVAFGIVDHDYDLILKKLINNPNVFYMDHHDFLVCAFLSDALIGTLIRENVTDDLATVRRNVFDSAKMPGIIRLINKQNGWKLDLKEYAVLFSGFEAKQAAQKLLNEKLRNVTLTEDVEEQINVALADSHPVEHLCQGHDVCKFFNTRYSVKSGSCSDFLMSAYGPSQFSQTKIFRELEDFFTAHGIHHALIRVVS